MSAWPRSLVLVGAGKMGAAMLDGWLAAGLPPEGVTVIEPKPAPGLLEKTSGAGIKLNPPAGALTPPDALVLAVKPQVFAAAAEAVAPLAGRETLTLSIMAGKRISDIRVRLPQAGAIVRAMPNTPAAVGRGVTAAVASQDLGPVRKAWTERLFGAVGAFRWLDDEALIDAVTAISGSGPAYVFALVEAMATAGEKLGLPAEVALALARGTVEGAGELLYCEPETSAAKLRENVTSPGGTTAAALEVLCGEAGLDALLARATAAARRRASELAG
jgi:pyrroline-5-carboxylate reductase